ncbi:dienelactone hydrolase family protein [Stigmatella sp. ncwal1]|uniref:Dienelactone hydrolase family protein n=1 Tax=Stigmatella ashevillensis TaxID=2995309 RepID=A0ABT5DFQ3_9BACT|nr:dienelactone hydrolase family protein [Stigmatella ashevillena]MDC0711618.1 dienelactone hydrolase family protein [Stigmatella ashevillena]
MRDIGRRLAAEGYAVLVPNPFLAWLDQQPQVNTRAKIGVQGYCMGGPLTFRTAALSERVGVVASFHGGFLVTPAPDSPHLLAPKLKAEMLIAVAANDDERDPQAKVKLKEAFDAAQVKNTIEVYGAQHGWCVKDMASGI